MTRVEENKMIVSGAIKRAEDQPTGTYEEMVTFQLGLIATMLADISKSQALLADKEDKCEVLDKIRAEIEAKCCITVGRENDGAITLHDVFEIIDKHKEEGE